MRLAPPVEQMIFEKIQPETKEERANTFKHLFVCCLPIWIIIVFRWIIGGGDF
jgi:bacteriorhodopsin